MLNYPQVNYGPLAYLFGTWEGDKGLDISPEPDAIEENPYYEVIAIEDAGDLKNAEEQHIAIARYHQVVHGKSNNEVFHDQCGYWMWQVGTTKLFHSISIPRGLSLVAQGTIDPTWESCEEIDVTVVACATDVACGISQTQFLLDKAKTTAYSGRFVISNSHMRYEQSTKLAIYDRNFDHTDTSVLVKKSQA